MPIDLSALRGSTQGHIEFNAAIGPGVAWRGSNLLRRWAEANHLDGDRVRSFAIKGDVLYVTYYAIRDKSKRHRQAQSIIGIMVEDFDQDLVQPLPAPIAKVLEGWRDPERTWT